MLNLLPVTVNGNCGSDHMMAVHSLLWLILKRLDNFNRPSPSLLFNNKRKQMTSYNFGTLSNRYLLYHKNIID